METGYDEVVMSFGESTDTSPELSASELHGYLLEMAQYGNRWLGTPAETKVRDYIVNKLRENGLEDVHLEEFDYQNYMPKHSKLTVTSPVNESIRCEPLEFSANDVAEGDLIYVGQGNQEDFEALEKTGVSFDGKIVMTNSEIPFAVVPIGEEKGAAGFVVATDPPDDLIGMFVAKLTPELEDPTKQVTKRPGVDIPWSGAQRLWSLMSTSKVKVRVEHEGIYSVKKTANVVGKVTGSRFPEEQVILGAHYDSQIHGELAWDNLTGVAAILEIAKVFAKKKPLRTVVFIAFTGEEVGLWGSAAYAKTHEADLRKNCVAMFCLDAISSAYPTARGAWANGPFLDFIVKRGKELGWEIETTQDPAKLPPFSDYSPFLDIGIPSTWIWESTPLSPYYHTEGDVSKYIDRDKLGKAASFYKDLAYDLAYKPEIPFPRTES